METKKMNLDKGMHIDTAREIYENIRDQQNRQIEREREHGYPERKKADPAEIAIRSYVKCVCFLEMLTEEGDAKIKSIAETILSKKDNKHSTITDKQYYVIIKFLTEKMSIDEIIEKGFAQYSKKGA
jgi:hypothetical protein